MSTETDWRNEITLIRWISINSIEGYDRFMKLIKRAATVIAAASVVLSLASCGSNLSWAAKIGKDTTVPIGLYIYNQASVYRNAVQNGLLSSSEKLSEQTVTVSESDSKATEYLDKEAKKAVKSYVGACLMAKDYNIELTDEEISSAAESAQSTYDTDKDVFEKNGIAQSSIEEYYKDLARKSKLFTAKYGKDGTESIKDDELKEYIKANYASINFIQQYFYNDDGTAMTDKEKEALTKEYKDIQAKAEKGKLDFAKKCEEFNKNATSYKGGYTNSTSRFDTDSEDGEKIMSLKTGQFTMLVTDSAIALIQKAKLDTSSLIDDENRDSLLIEYKYEDFVKELEVYSEKNESVVFNDKAFEKFGSSSRDFSELSIPNSYY